MSASFRMEDAFRGPLAPGYCDIINLTLNKRFSDTPFPGAHYRRFAATTGYRFAATTGCYRFAAATIHALAQFLNQGDQGEEQGDDDEADHAA